MLWNFEVEYNVVGSQLLALARIDSFPATPVDAFKMRRFDKEFTLLHHQNCILLKRKPTQLPVLE